MGTISGGPVYRSFTPGTIKNQRGLFDHKSRAESRTDLYPHSVVIIKDYSPVTTMGFQYGLTVLLVEETGVPGGNDRPSASNCQTFSHAAK